MLALAASPLRVVGERLGRAAIFSIGAAAMTNVVGCGAKSELSIGPSPAVHTDAAFLDDGGAPHTHYGGPPVRADAATNDAAVEDVGAIGVLYGGPWPEPDAGVDAGCSNADYGAPPCP